MPGKAQMQTKSIERLNESSTRESMVSASLQVEGGQVQCQLAGELKQSLPQLIRQHVILRVQLGFTTHQAPDDWVHTT